MGQKRGRDVCWGEYVPHGHLDLKNLVNGSLVALACLPSLWCVARLKRSYALDPDAAWSEGRLARFYIERPNLFLQWLFLWNISLGFWVVGLIQRSFWLIDPYWTIFPVLAAHFYASHPLAAPIGARQATCLVLIWTWSLRLSWNYFRREDFKFGQREDWRYTDMAKRHGKVWWVLSFFAVGVAQQIVLCALVAPMHPVTTSEVGFGASDALAVAGCVGGIAVAFLSDNQLHYFCEENRSRRSRSLPLVAVLNTGMWSISRHPNYVGEQIWWWSFASLAVSAERGGGAWSLRILAGPFVNSLLLVKVTHMTEARMLGRWTKERAAEYRRYMRKTPAFVWPVF